MKNMKISTKLLISFILIAILTVTVGIVGIYGLRRTDGAYSSAIDTHGKPLAEISHALDALEKSRIDLIEAILNAGIAELLNDIEQNLASHLEMFEANVALYDKTIVSPEAREIFGLAMNTYHTVYKPTLQKIIVEAKKGATQSDLEGSLTTVEESVIQMAEGFSKTMDLKIELLDQTSEAGSELADSLFIILTVISALAVISAIVLGIYISHMISKPMVFLEKVMSDLAHTGNFQVDADTAQQIEKYSIHKDESGRMSDSFASLIGMMQDKLHTLEAVSTGDLTTNVVPRSENDSYGNAMQTMVDRLSVMFGEIHSSTVQVSTGAKQVADGAQALAQGSTEQAASIEELSASISEIAERTRANAETAENTSKLSTMIIESAEKGNHQMSEMIQAVGEINEASHSIGKIIKTIDDIAFQTNILALNAAVEAARAGQHGKGFAVVAEEVRNLAAKSAEAAKDTGNMIQNSMERAQLGSRIANETAASLLEIIIGISESSKLIEEIATASEEQSVRVSQINIGIDQVAQVIQQNSATAEESAAASEQMSSQSTMLEELISQFKLKKENERQERPAPREKLAGKQTAAPNEGPAERQTATPSKTFITTVARRESLGKY